MDTATQIDPVERERVISLNVCKKHGKKAMDVRVSHDGMVTPNMLVPFCKVCKAEEDAHKARLAKWGVRT